MDSDAWAAANERSDDLRLVRAVLVAGLYPNVARADPPSRPTGNPRLAFFSEQGREEMCAFHPCSVSFDMRRLQSRWLVFHEMVRTTSVFLRDATPVSPYQLMLFGGSISVQHGAGTVSLDRWITFAAPPKVAVLFKEIRGQLDALLAAKIAQPGLDLRQAGFRVLDAICQLLTTEPAPKGV